MSTNSCALDTIVLDGFRVGRTRLEALTHNSTILNFIGQHTLQSIKKIYSESAVYRIRNTKMRVYCIYKTVFTKCCTSMEVYEK